MEEKAYKINLSLSPEEKAMGFGDTVYIQEVKSAVLTAEMTDKGRISHPIPDGLLVPDGNGEYRYVELNNPSKTKQETIDNENL